MIGVIRATYLRLAASCRIQNWIFVVFLMMAAYPRAIVGAILIGCFIVVDAAICILHPVFIADMYLIIAV